MRKIAKSIVNVLTYLLFHLFFSYSPKSSIYIYIYIYIYVCVCVCVCVCVFYYSLSCG